MGKVVMSILITHIRCNQVVKNFIIYESRRKKNIRNEPNKSSWNKLEVIIVPKNIEVIKDEKFSYSLIIYRFVRVTWNKFTNILYLHGTNLIITYILHACVMQSHHYYPYTIYSPVSLCDTNISNNIDGKKEIISL